MSRSPYFAAARPSKEEQKRKIETYIRNFGPHLGIAQHVEISIISRNPRLISVAYAPGRTDLFRMSFEEGFLLSLDDDELRAAVAHEMGHIWIYTHFPFLQTERLANQQARKLVTRADLARLYARVWAHNGETGDLAEVLGPPDDAGGRKMNGGVRNGAPNPAAASAPRGPKVLVVTPAGYQRLNGLSGDGEPGLAPIPSPELAGLLAKSCPECRLSDSRDDADFVVTIGSRTQNGSPRWFWAVYEREGRVLARGSTPIAGSSAEAALRTLRTIWRRIHPSARG